MTAIANNFSTNRRRRGTILIVTMTVCIALAVVVMVLCKSMATEALASANHAASIQADAVARGAEEYVINLLATNGPQVLSLTEDYFRDIAVGDGTFTIFRPDYGDSDLPAYGLVDECSKLSLNANWVTRTNPGLLLWLPGMTEDVAASIHDWRDTNPDPESYGAEDDYYLSLDEPYRCKNAEFETVEELRLVRGVTRQMLWGDGTAGPLGTQSAFSSTDRPLFSDPMIGRGLYDVFTVHSLAQNPTDSNGPPAPLLNINTAPRVVLSCLTAYGLEQGDIDKLIAARAQLGDLSTPPASWAGGAIANFNLIREFVTGQSYYYSADIVAVSANLRAFKRVRIILDSRTSPATIVYRRDMTERGDEQMRQSLRTGQNTGGMLP